MLPQSNGIIHWSISSVTKNPSMAKGLITGPYRKQALVPNTPWLDNKAPEAPKVSTEIMGNTYKVKWTHSDFNDVFRWVLYYKYGTTWQYKILNKNDRSFELDVVTNNAQKNNLGYIAVTAVDRVGNESVLKEILISDH
jgi:hypothetical protein